MARLSGYLKRKTEFNYKNNYIHIPIILWILTGVTFMVLLCLNSENDPLITSKQSINFWSLLFEGRPLDFYVEARMTTGNAYYPNVQDAGYLFPVYLVFAVWNLPTWILSQITGTELINTVPSMIWMKLMYIPFIALSARSIFRIVDSIDSKKEYAHLASFLFSSSVLLFITTALLGQYDIIETAFILLGYEGWIKKNNKRFIVFFAVAILFKYFAFLYFLPLLLLGEKRIRKILLSLVQVIVPIIPFLLVFPKPDGQVSLVSWYLNKLCYGIQLNDDTVISVFPFVFVLVSVACIFTHIDDKNRLRQSVYYLFLIMGSFCVLISPHTQWTLLAVPVLVLSCFTTNNMNKTVILETLLGIGIAIKNYIKFCSWFNIRTTGSMGLLHKLFGKQAPPVDGQTSLMVYLLESTSILNVFYTLVLVLFILMIWFSRPKAKKEKLFEPFNMGTVYARTALNVITALLPTMYLAAYTIFRA